MTFMFGFIIGGIFTFTLMALFIGANRGVKTMSNKKDIENWLLSRDFFVDCRRCVCRKKGCYKDCKFYHGYRRNGGDTMKGEEHE